MNEAVLKNWVNQNSGSFHPEGLARMADALTVELARLDGDLERIKLPEQRMLDGGLVQPGDVLRFQFRPQAPIKVLFSGHMDTVFGPEQPFQSWLSLDDGRINGPGVADMKGGLFIMISAVAQFLETDQTNRIGGEILITADEEIGSPGSHALLLEAAKRNHIGLVFESSLPGGELVCRRKGTGTYRITASGKSAHTGRDFENGRNAIVPMASLILQCHDLNAQIPDAIVNVGTFKGGGTVNIVPAHAEAWLNIRVGKRRSVSQIEARLETLIRKTKDQWKDVELSCSGSFARPPKEETPADAALHRLWNEAEGRLGLPLSRKRETGGSSDGNVFAEAGLPHLDGIGIRGGGIHSPDEFALLDSIPGQIARTVGFLRALSTNPEELKQPPFSRG